MKIGYARVSTLEQGNSLDNQRDQLKAAGCDKVFAEQASAVKERPELDKALDYLREGDSLVVARLDRLARSVAHLMQIKDYLDQKGANLVILNLSIDTGTATGKLMFSVVGAVAEFERELLLERQREGIARAKAAGKYKGRKPTAREKADDVKRLHDQGVGPTDISRELGISRASVYRCLAA